MINIMRWLYELFNVDQIRIIFVSMFSSLLAYLTPTKGFLIALVIMFGFNIWCGMRADGVSVDTWRNNQPSIAGQILHVYIGSCPGKSIPT